MRFAVLDGWRGLCALVVALHHFQAGGHFFALPFLRNAWLFVDFFFVLSGFVIAHAYGESLRRDRDLAGFAIRRLGRLWPLHAAVLAGFVALEGLKLALMAGLGMGADNPPFSGETSLPALASNLALVHAWGLHDGATWNFPSWSISTEWAAYLTFGLVAAAGLAARPLAPLALAAGGAAVVAALSAEGLHVIADWGVFRCLYGFFTGVLVHQALGGARPRIRLPHLAEPLAIGLVVLFVTLTGKDASSLAAPLVFALAVAVFAGEAGFLSRLLATRPVQALGAYSYSLYLVHSLLLVVLGRAVNLVEARTGLALTAPLEVNGQTRVLLLPDQPFLADGLALAYLAVLIGVSALTWRWIERPGQLLFNRWAGARRVAPAE